MNIKESIESVRNLFRTDSDPLPKDSKDLELLHIKYLGRKGLVADLFNNLKDVPSEDRPILGKVLNDLKNEISKSLIGIKGSSFSEKNEESTRCHLYTYLLCTILVQICTISKFYFYFQNLY